MFIPIFFPFLFSPHVDRTEEIKSTIREEARRVSYEQQTRTRQADFDKKFDWGEYRINLSDGGTIHTRFVLHPSMSQMMFIKIRIGNDICIYRESYKEDWDKSVIEVKTTLKEKGVELNRVIPMPWLKQRENANA